MAEYYLTNKAVEDLSAIWKYTVEKWSEEQADKYYFHLIESMQMIANNPSIGKNYSQVMEQLNGIQVNRHIIFYRVISPALIEITRVLHERMDLKNRLSE